VLALAADSGRELWRLPVVANDVPVSVAAGSAGVMIANDQDLTLRNLRTGAVTATKPLPAALLNTGAANAPGPSAAILVADDRIAVATAAPELVVYGTTLNERWRHHFNLHHDPGAVELTATGDAIYMIDQVADPTTGC